MNHQGRYITMMLALILAGCGDSQPHETPGKGTVQKAAERMEGSPTPAPPSTVSAQTQPDAPLPAFLVVDRTTYDVPMKTQIQLAALVSGPLTEFGLTQLLQKLYDEANATREFKYHGGKPTHVFIYLFTSQDHFKSGLEYWIAMLSKTGEGARINTYVKTKLIAQLDAKPEIKHGLAESKRQEIYRAIIFADSRAEADAQRMYPLPDPLKPGYSQAQAHEQILRKRDAKETLVEKYEMAVAKRYRIKEATIHDIAVEGFTKNWPIPPK